MRNFLTYYLIFICIAIGTIATVKARTTSDLSNAPLSVADIQRSSLEEENAILKEQLRKARAERDDLRETLSETLELSDVIQSLRDTGKFGSVSIENIREFLEITDQIPYGSPFASGHWISSPFGLRDEHLINGNNYTEGIDLVGKRGDCIVRTTADGIIEDFGYSETYGKYIIVKHPGGFWTQYSHLSKIFWQDEDHNVKGVPLRKGDRIGIMGNTGLCFSENGGDGTHLDYRIWMTEEGHRIYLNPTAIIKYSGGDIQNKGELK